jgi:hypothetical protein
LSNILNFAYPTFLKVPTELLFKEIKQAIFKIKKNNASNLNKISNRVIHLIIRTSPAIIIHLFQACIDQEVYSKIFKKATTVIIRKDGDRDYSNSKAYKSIALLNTLKKALEAVISNRIRFLAKIHTLLPNTQIEAQRMRFINIILQLITEKIHAI